MPAARPWGQEQQQPRSGGRGHLVALAGRELHQQPNAAGRAVPLRGRHLDLPVEHDKPRALVHLVVCEALAAARLSAIARAASLEERISGSRGFRSSVFRSQLFTITSSLVGFRTLAISRG
jgi:hypothetical protein